MTGTATPGNIRPGRQPVRLVITAPGQPGRTSLIDWLHQRPEFRTSVRDTGRRTGGRAGFSDAVIIAVVAESLLPGLFDLLKTWLAGQRSETSIRMRVGDSELEVQVTGRTDPLRLLAEVRRGLDHVATPPGGRTDPGIGSGPDTRAGVGPRPGPGPGS